MTFESDDHVMRIIERIVAPLGRRIDESSPYVDARLPDGSRVNAIIPPLSLVGPVLTIRKFARSPITVEQLIQFGTLTPEAVQFLKACVEARLNIVISGGTGSGKTTLLNVLSGFIPSDERIITIENAAELQLRQEHVVTLESRPPNIEGKGEITIRQLVINALRMRPDRIIVGEIRDEAALDMLQAMNTGHDGSMTTAHANTPRDVLSRLETMVLMAGMELTIRAIREQVSSAIDLIVHQERMRDGTRKVVNITEVTGMEGDVITMMDIFTFEQLGIENGKVIGSLRPTGLRPKFMEKFEAAGIHLPASTFQLRRERHKPEVKDCYGSDHNSDRCRCSRHHRAYCWTDFFHARTEIRCRRTAGAICRNRGTCCRRKEETRFYLADRLDQPQRCQVKLWRSDRQGFSKS